MEPHRCFPHPLVQDMSLWEQNGETEGVKTYSGTGKFASARGDGIIPFPAKCVPAGSRARLLNLGGLQQCVPAAAG